MAQIKAKRCTELIEFSAYMEARCSKMYIECQYATLHADTGNITDALARCFISLSHQAMFTIGQDGVNVFNELCVSMT